MRCVVLVSVAAMAVLTANSVRADVFNMPGDQTSLQFVTVGDPGNAPDTVVTTKGVPSPGSVGYVYRIGKYDVTIGQYLQFLKAVAKTDPYGVYNPVQDSYYPKLAIVQSGISGSYTYSIGGAGYNGDSGAAADCPIYGVSWGSAARFCNWLQNGQPTGAEGSGTTETGVYTLNGVTDNTSLVGIRRNGGAGYFLPTEDEWYKGAYYKGGGTNVGYWLYPTRSDTTPSNVLSATGTNNANFYDAGYTDPANDLTPVGTFAASPGPYGTYDMGGDVWQWNEAVIGSYGRGVRGGDCHLDYSYLASSYCGDNYNGSPPANGYSTEGFRVAGVPEPGSIAMLAGMAVMLLLYGFRKHVML